MLTQRGWWFFLLSFTLVAFAGLVPPHGHASLVLIGLTLLLWFAAQWLLFRIRAYRIRDRLAIDRGLRDGRGPVDNLWARRPFEVRLRVRHDGAYARDHRAGHADKYPHGKASASRLPVKVLGPADDKTCQQRTKDLWQALLNRLEGEGHALT